MASGRKWGSGFAVDDVQVNASGVHDWPFNAEFPVDLLALVNDHVAAVTKKLEGELATEKGYVQ